jgi:hypothetical protein
VRRGPEFGGFGDTASGFAAGDVQLVGQDPAGLATDLGRVGGGQLIHQWMLHRRQAASQLLAAPQQRHTFPRCQRIKVQLQRPIQISRERVEGFDDLPTTTRTHVLRLAAGSDKPRKLNHT